MAVSRRNGYVSFGVFEVNAEARELRKHGIRVRLAGQPFAILLALLEQAGGVIGREDLRRRLWPDNTVVDFEHGLNSAVKKLRAALGDSAESPRYIETLPRVGYRFIAPIYTIDPVPDSAKPFPAMPSADTSAGSSHSPRRRRLWLALVAATITVLAGTAPVLFPRPLVRVTAASRLTTDSRADRWGRIQTDGVRLFFLERRGHRWDLMQMPASGGAVQAFSTPFPNSRILAVSPDSSSLIVGSFTARGKLLPLWVMATVGGAPTRVADIRALDAVFTRDGTQITYSTDDGLYEVRRDGSEQRKLLPLPGVKDSLAWSPDGRVLRFEWTDPITHTDAIWEVDAHGQHLHGVLPGWDKDPSQCCGRWTADGRYYIFVSHNHGGSQNIWALPEHRTLAVPSRPEPILVSTGPVVMDQPLPSPDGDRLFVLGANEQSEYVLLDPITRESHSLLGGEAAALLTFSSDGQSALYVSGNTLWRSKPDGTERREIVSESYHPARSRFSPDGKEIAFDGTVQDSVISKIYVVPAEGGAPREVVSASYAVADPHWSLDGNAIIYSVDSDDGPAAGLYVRDLKTGATTKVAGSEGYGGASWSPDGARLAAVTEDGSSVAVFDTRSRRWDRVARGGAFSPAVWSRDSKYVYFQDLVEEHEPVRRVDVATGRVERVAEFQALLEGGVQRCGFEQLAPDGRLALRLTRGDHDVYALKLELK